MISNDQHFVATKTKQFLKTHLDQQKHGQPLNQKQSKFLQVKSLFRLGLFSTFFLKFRYCGLLLPKQ